MENPTTISLDDVRLGFYDSKDCYGTSTNDKEHNFSTLQITFNQEIDTSPSFTSSNAASAITAKGYQALRMNILVLVTSIRTFSDWTTFFVLVSLILLRRGYKGASPVNGTELFLKTMTGCKYGNYSLIMELIVKFHNEQLLLSPKCLKYTCRLTRLMLQCRRPSNLLRPILNNSEALINSLTQNYYIKLPQNNNPTFNRLNRHSSHRTTGSLYIRNLASTNYLLQFWGLYPALEMPPQFEPTLEVWPKYISQAPSTIFSHFHLYNPGIKCPIITSLVPNPAYDDTKIRRFIPWVPVIFIGVVFGVILGIDSEDITLGIMPPNHRFTRLIVVLPSPNHCKFIEETDVFILSAHKMLDGKPS
ncbi:uncharacterized protein BDR25DRAFT_353430 [Lindgomyces ingoldianus]|uniref:Uncharacterized protein n=1 Tax=Lindgomyces ingoldianus TaxID=673940 RepID=A0ACB6QZD6_9PLEO|nr:uncharacterized protein BDR25DRAFT_353430 [Lindgomyces ingoldianus]KAF2472404.1 hypothetical protein BDR25DRAFT_353430 [Lindgomyces ingoldianus]